MYTGRKTLIFGDMPWQAMIELFGLNDHNYILREACKPDNTIPAVKYGGGSMLWVTSQDVNQEVKGNKILSWFWYLAHEAIKAMT